MKIKAKRVVRTNLIGKIGKIRFKKRAIWIFTLIFKIDVFDVIGGKTTAACPQIDVANQRQTQVKIVVRHAANIHRLGLWHAGEVVECQIALSK